MSSSKLSPSYNLGAVIRETGINADTLRAWERRYNLPQPARSEGGHRLYSQRDLQIIKWLIDQQEAGMRIGQAAKLWQEQVTEGLDPLQGDVHAQLQASDSPSIREKIIAFRTNWVSACTDFNEAQAEQIVTEAFSLYPPEMVCFDVLFAGLHEIGEAWYRGEASVQQEHFASGLVARRLNALIAGAAPPVRFEHIVVAAPAEEEHTLSALILAYLLRRRGWNVVNLGADVPLEDFRNTIEALRPHLIVMTAHQLPTAATLLDHANVLAQMQIRLAYGGVVFNRIPNLHERIPGFYLGEELKDSLIKIEELISTPNELPRIPMENSSPHLEHFQAIIPVINSRLHQALSDYPELSSAPIQYISHDILAALKLGNISFVNEDLVWVHGMLSHLQIPDQALQDFLQIYAQVVEEESGGDGGAVLNWLNREIERLKNRR